MLNFLFPKECLICFKTGSWLCEKCRKNLFNTLPNCYICKKLSNKYQTHSNCKNTNSLKQVITLWKYNQYSKKLIYNFKYKNRIQIGNFLFSLFKQKLEHLDFTNSIFIPTPSHQKKVLERGFNPTEVFCNLIANNLSVNVNSKFLLKKSSNTSQASLQYTERFENVKDIFAVNEKEISNILKYKKIIIIDDIITTGATLNEISRTIKGSLKEDIEISSLCIFQGNFKNEHQKFLQPNTTKKEKI